MVATFLLGAVGVDKSMHGQVGFIGSQGAVDNGSNSYRLADS